MNYSDCIIYKITCKNSDIKSTYVGHTFNLNRRSAEHKSICNNPNNNQYNSKLYTSIRTNGGFNNWTIEAIENYVDCSSVDDARARERYWCEELNADLNKNKPIISNEELKEHIKQYQQGEKYKNYQKDYQQTDKYKNYQREYKKEYNKGEKYKNYQKDYQREYRQTENYKNYQREYRLKQKLNKQEQPANTIYNIKNLTVNYNTPLN